MKNINISVFSAFAGYDSQFLALRKFAKWFNRKFKGLFHLEFDLAGWCEIDKYAIASHNALFPEYKDRHYPDIKNVPWHKLKFDILFYSSCCQDITNNGNQKGFVEGSGTRSSLLWYVLPGIRQCRPQCCILENVSALLENKFSNEFRKWQEAVDNENQLCCTCGPQYVSTWSTLSAINLGVPQNRDRSFMVSFRRDIAKRCEFPIQFALTKDAESVLEKSAEKHARYYIPEEDVVKFVERLDKKNMIKTINVSKPNFGHDTCVKRIFTPSCKNISQKKNKRRTYHICPTLLAGNGDYTKVSFENFLTTAHFPRPAALEVWESSDTRLISRQKLKKVSESCSVVKDSTANPKEEKKICNDSKDDIIDAIGSLKSNEYVCMRKLSIWEIFRLMGMNELDINKLANSGVPESQLYKQAGNAIVIDVLFHLYQSIFTDIPTWWNTPLEKKCPYIN